MNIKVFYHAVDLPHFSSIVNEQLNEIKISGLLDVSEIYVVCNYNESSYDLLKQQYKNCANIQWLSQKNIPNDFEIPTLNLMKDMADHSENEFLALYLHCKGITHIGSHCETPTKHWRWLMNYFNITRWKDCVSKLNEGYDAVGCLMNNDIMPKHFSGNFHWTRSTFLKKCNKLKLPHTVNFSPQIPHNRDYRFDAEAWYGHNNAKMYDFFQSHLNHYYDEFPPNLYTNLY